LSTRARLADLRVTYLDATSGAKIKDFTLSSAVGHPSTPAGRTAQQRLRQLRACPARLMSILASPITAGRISGYAVQLDSVTSDGSFFLMTEEP
jgi:hypothetical protein